MRDPNTKSIYLKDYTPPAFLIDRVELDVHLQDDCARVRSRLAVRRNPAMPGSNAALTLDGEELQTESVAVDGRPLSAGEYLLAPAQLCIPTVPAQFSLETTVRIEPHRNTQLSGLYVSKDGFFTQSEAQGFRRITWFLDRPDVMARYLTTIHADRTRYPVLLSNGNLVAQGEEEGGRHWARWEDPFPKPSYLFAMVAAKLDRLTDAFVTRSGRRVDLSIYVELGKLDQCDHAMQALKKAMRWDEEVFGLELDLDCYMIVAVGDFNMGAMENKGLNIFNTKYVLARQDTATDVDFQNIDRVVAHEYFHNWTGNRVTCRDWFQLSLKEGLTVFRDQEFGADMHSRALTRIQEVRDLRNVQFAEDAGPMAHPVRPASYVEISNFYTSTVYEKGAEVVRMIHTLIGAQAFRRGMDLYFERHDGQAVTCDDFVEAMQDASGVDLAQFRRWYDQSGTPVVEAEGEYDPRSRRFTLLLRQSCPPTAGQAEKLPLHIPIALGLVGPNGTDLPLRPAGEAAAEAMTCIVSLRAAEERFVFEDVALRPVPSLLRGFSAPVILKYPYTEAELTHLMAHDSDTFNRWEAGQRLAEGILLSAIRAYGEGEAPEVPGSFVAAAERILASGAADPAFAAEALQLPAETLLAERMDTADPDAIHAARLWLRGQLATRLRAQLLAVCDAAQTSGPYRADAESVGRRALRNTCLSYLMELDDAEIRDLCLRQFRTGDNMTDTLAALSSLANCECAEREQALEEFYGRWKGEALVVDKWLAVQAGSRLPDTLERVRSLLKHPAFDLRNPNKVYALIMRFCAGNPVRFHAASGAGYDFAAEQILALDPLNAQVAARIARSFDRWRKCDARRQARAQAALQRIAARANLSKDVHEVVSRALS
jgi:aminopeptidase N